jgi:anti-anti-sigma factor
VTVRSIPSGQPDSRVRFLRSATLALTVETDGSTVCFQLAGELDMASVQQLELALDSIDGDTHCLVFDLQQVEFIDLAGLRAILGANEQGRRRGFGVKVIKPQGLASRIFTLTPIGRDIEFADPVTPEQARSAPNPG